MQAKAFCNNLVQSSHALALKKWISITGVDGNKCTDYTHILNDNIEMDESKCNTKHHDYHNLEIDEDGNVNTAYRQDDIPEFEEFGNGDLIFLKNRRTKKMEEYYKIVCADGSDYDVIDTLEEAKKIQHEAALLGEKTRIVHCKEEINENGETVVYPMAVL